MTLALILIFYPIYGDDFASANSLEVTCATKTGLRTEIFFQKA